MKKLLVRCGLAFMALLIPFLWVADWIANLGNPRNSFCGWFGSWRSSFRDGQF